MPTPAHSQPIPSSRPNPTLPSQQTPMHPRRSVRPTMGFASSPTLVPQYTQRETSLWSFPVETPSPMPLQLQFPFPQYTLEKPQSAFVLAPAFCSWQRHLAETTCKEMILHRTGFKTFAKFIQINTENQRKWEEINVCSKKKNKIKLPGKNPSEAELSNLSDQEFKTSVIKNAHQTQMKRGTRWEFQQRIRKH